MRTRHVLVCLAAACFLSAATATTVAHAAPARGTVIFRDDFTGSSLDLTKWRPNWLGASNATITPPINGAELSCYDPANVSVSGGYLHLKAENRPCTDKNGKTWAWASGIVTSAPHFTYTYGRLTARVLLPNANNANTDWPSVWADGTGQWPTTGENDVLETLHGQTCWHFHSTAGGPGGCSSPTLLPGKWHTVTATWRPGKVSYSYDGIHEGTITTGITGSPMFVILNLGVSTSISPPALGAEYLIDKIVVTQS